MKAVRCGGSNPFAFGAKRIAQLRTSLFGLNGSKPTDTSWSSGTSNLDSAEDEDCVLERLECSLGALPAAGAPSIWGCGAAAGPASATSIACAVRMPTKNASCAPGPSAGASTIARRRSTINNCTFWRLPLAVTSVVWNARGTQEPLDARRGAMAVWSLCCSCSVCRMDWLSNWPLMRLPISISSRPSDRTMLSASLESQNVVSQTIRRSDSTASFSNCRFCWRSCSTTSQLWNTRAMGTMQTLMIGMNVSPASLMPIWAALNMPPAVETTRNSKNAGSRMKGAAVT
mmetsp:Transcript_62429/g.172999  ORF Transcript_62429/g.172999 Transcript_62429/m.172999 type:complete len:287 (-) Transcript_62429:43-903(-)